MSKDLEIIRKFCEDGNGKRLLKLSEKIKILFIHAARVAIYRHGIRSKKRKLAYTVLEVLSPLDCIKRSKIELREVQKNVSRYFNTHDALLLVWGTGCGKTLAALTISQCYIDRHPKDNVIMISPASLLGNFKKEMKKYGGKLMDRYHFYSFEKFLSREKKRKRIGCKNSLLIIDEVHNLRNYMGVKYEAAMECAKRARKVLLLTATPVVNTLRDLVSIVNLLSRSYAIAPAFRGKTPKRKMVVDEKKRKVVPKIYKNAKRYLKIPAKVPKEGESYKDTLTALDSLTDLLDGKVSYQEKCSSPDFPDFEIHREAVQMSPDYYKRYLDAVINMEIDLFNRPEVFLHGYRKALNKSGLENEYYSDKLEKAFSLIGNKQSVIYSTWLEFGMEPITHVLDQMKLKYSIISGSVNKSDREKAVRDFNDEKVQILLITKAGGEGIDLKGVRNIIIIDPTWNPSSMEQIMGRGIRYKSHDHLPPEERKGLTVTMFNVQN